MKELTKKQRIAVANHCKDAANEYCKMTLADLASVVEQLSKIIYRVISSDDNVETDAE